MEVFPGLTVLHRKLALSELCIFRFSIIPVQDKLKGMIRPYPLAFEGQLRKKQTPRRSCCHLWSSLWKGQPWADQGKEGKPIPSQSPRNSHGCGYLEHAEIKDMSIEDLDGSDSYRENYMTKCLPGLEVYCFRLLYHTFYEIYL
ncbi:Unconventional Myosin-Xv [Manis pentadactyla]|nr:Unconventional Myosin-Xv [Manis pentadactyla]